MLTMKHHHGIQSTLHLTVIAAALSILHVALAYDTGSMSCSDIGDFAAATVVGKENDATLKEALAKVNKRTEGYPVEHKNLTQIVRAICTEPWVNKISPAGQANCRKRSSREFARDTPATTVKRSRGG
jgi:hypothetical protein